MNSNYTKQILEFKPEDGDANVLKNYLNSTVNFINSLDEFW